MTEILYIGFGEVMKSVQSRLSSRADMRFREVLQLGTDGQAKVLDKADVFLVGPYTVDPLRQIQRANQQNPVVAIIVLIFPDQFQSIKQRIQFAYNIGKNVTFVPYDLNKDISEVLENAAQRTRQRKSFSKIQEQQHYPAATNREMTFLNLGVFLEKAPLGAIVFDLQRNVISANYKAKQMFEVLKNAKQKISWVDLFPDEDILVRPYAADGDEPVHEVIKVNSQFLDINISTILMEKEEPHYLLLINDVTDKINAENLLKSKVDELEFLNQEMDDFINVVSHDFKTPLTSIGLLAELALRETSQEKQINFLQQIKQSSNKLRELLKGLSVLVDTKKERSEKIQQVDFAERLNLVLSEYDEMLKELGAEVHADFSSAPDMPYYLAHIDSFLSNLITNAIKYRNKEVPLRVDIKTRREKEYVIISVKDNGIGIDLAKHMNKLFQPFKRLTDQGTGSGLGLSIMKRMIEKDHGYLEVFSEPGKGTEFKAYLREQQ